MDAFEIIGGIMELISSWRFYLCVAAGLLLLFAILHFVPYVILARVLAGGVFVGAFIGGWRWEASSG